MAYLPTPLRRVLRISGIVRVYYFEYTPSFIFAGESHDFWEMVYVDSGAIQVQSGEAFHLVEAGSAVFHQPNEFHSLQSYHSCPNLIILSFRSKDSALEPLKQLCCRILPQERGLLGSLVAEARMAFANPVDKPSEGDSLLRRAKAPLGSEQLVACYLEQLLISILRRQTPQLGETGPLLGLELTLPQCENEHITRVLAYLSQNLYRRLSLADICRENGIGRSRIQQLFKQELGCGVSDYLGRMKADAAKILLRQDNKSVSEISDLLGYSTTSYFTSQFKKAFGISPTQYRKKLVDITKSRSRL